MSNEGNANDAPEALPRGYVIRLVGLVGIGVLVCWWLARYTDFFPEVATLLALGGIFSWIAVAFQLLPEGRVKALQAALDTSVFCNPRTRRWAGSLGVVLFVLANCCGAIRIESALSEGSVAVVLYRGPDATREERAIPPAGGMTMPVRTYWWRPASFQVKVAGFPERSITVWPWAREILSVPQSFQRTVVLLRPSAKLYKDIHKNPMKLVVTVAGHNFEKEFDGVPMWLSSDEDLTVPSELRTDWSFTVSPAESAYFVHAWSEPRAFFDVQQEVPHGSEITLQLYYPSKAACYPQPRKIIVSDLGRSRSFVQEEVLDECQEPTQ